jgi:hypothetical protein
MPLQVSQTLAGLQVGEVGTKWTRAGTELFAINTRRDEMVDLIKTGITLASFENVCSPVDFLMCIDCS